MLISRLKEENQTFCAARGDARTGIWVEPRWRPHPLSTPRHGPATGSTTILEESLLTVRLNFSNFLRYQK